MLKRLSYISKCMTALRSATVVFEVKESASTVMSTPAKSGEKLSNLICNDLQPASDGLHPSSDGLQPNSKRNLMAFVTTSFLLLLVGHLLLVAMHLLLLASCD